MATGIGKEAIDGAWPLLALMFRKEEVAVPINASARSELIDLMARILVVVFQAKGEDFAVTEDRFLVDP